MSDLIEWTGMDAGGFLTAEVHLAPFERVEIRPGREVYYTGEVPGTLRLYRDMTVHVGRIWMLMDPADSGPETHWHLQ